MIWIKKKRWTKIWFSFSNKILFQTRFVLLNNWFRNDFSLNQTYRWKVNHSRTFGSIEAPWMHSNARVNGLFMFQTIDKSFKRAAILNRWMSLKVHCAQKISLIVNFDVSNASILLWASCLSFGIYLTEFLIYSICTQKPNGW